MLYGSAVVVHHSLVLPHCEEGHIDAPTWQSGSLSFWHIHSSLIPHHRRRNSPELLKRRLNGGRIYLQHLSAPFSLVRGIRREKRRPSFFCMVKVGKDLIRLACGQPPDAVARACGPPKGKAFGRAAHRRPYGETEEDTSSGFASLNHLPHSAERSEAEPASTARRARHRRNPRLPSDSSAGRNKGEAFGRPPHHCPPFLFPCFPLAATAYPVLYLS